MKRLDSRYNQRQYYMEGNAARKLETIPERTRRSVRQDRPERQVNQHIDRNQNRAKAFDLRYTMVLMVATVFLFSSCINMLTMQASITEQRRQIAVLESNLNELTDTNNETSKRLESSVDLTKIYEVATRDLGMVYPKTGQITYYEATNPDYVKQFKDVPVK